MSAKYTMLMLRLRQNERYKDFDMVTSGTSVIHAAKQFGCSSFFVHNLMRRYAQTGISNDACCRSGIRKRRRDKTVNLLLGINVSSSSWQLWLLDASLFHTRRLETRFKVNDFLRVTFI